MSVNHSREILARLASVGPPVILLTAVVAGFIISAQVRSVVIEGAAQTISAGASGLAAPCLDIADGETSFSAQGCEALASAITQRQQAGQVQGYRLLRTDGTVLFSTDQAEIGHVVEIDGLEKAAGGEIDVATVGSESDPLVARVGHRLLRVVTPVRKGEAGAVLAVAESYKPYAPIAASVAESVLIVWLAVGGGALTTAVTIGYTAQRASRDLEETETRLDSLNTRLEDSLVEIESQSLGVLQALSAAVDARDHYTARHALGTTEIAFGIAAQLGFDEAQHTILERAALLHDIGKIGIPEALLLKPAALTDEEFEQVKGHSEAGARILQTIPFLADATPIVRYHHERWDGRGYPTGLAGEEIPLLARVLAAADAFDAMTSERPYRRPMSLADAIAEMKRGAGAQFDATVVAALLESLRGREGADGAGLTSAV